MTKGSFLLMTNKKTPLFLTDNFFLFPFCNKVLNLENNEDLKRVLVSAWKNGDGKVVIISSRAKLATNAVHTYDPEFYFEYGSLAKIEIDLAPDADVDVVFNSLGDVQLVGLERVQLRTIVHDEHEAVWKCDYEIIGEKAAYTSPQESKHVNLLIEKFVQCLPNLLKKTTLTMAYSLPYLAIGDFSSFVDFVVQNNDSLSRDFKQTIMEEPALEKRIKILLELEKKNRKIQQTISAKVSEKILEQQRSLYLREQLDVIQSEIDKLDGVEGDKDSYLKRLESEPYPEAVAKVIREQIRNYSRISSQSGEANIVRSYIEWLLNIPWYQTTAQKSDLKFAQQELDREHFGLSKIKERIIEHLAVGKRTAGSLGNIICFVGPPGVGKTSLASSIARATGRNFVRMSVGGVYDESEIRGHRRTYVGSLPGKIIQEMKKAKVINPLFLIDEVDKMGSDSFHGNPASALLEVLDPNQNSNFTDNYLGEVPYDLSKVLFICTANSENIARPLLDRMEIINLSSYTEIEKLHIAKNNLIPRNLKDYNFSPKELSFEDAAITEIIRSFTQEAGVRELNRNFQKIIRKFTLEVTQKKLKRLKISTANLGSYLGKKLYNFTAKQGTSQIGVVTGLAYTYAGGDILPIEVSYFQGKGELVLTGTLGDVMKESAKIALAYVKSNSQFFGINSELFSNNDLHLHVPEGATPKDGPSAGIAIATAIISALTGKTVSSELGMTGEITLRGHVLAIGGLREKAIAAHRSGLTAIIVPIENEKDLDEVPTEVKQQLKISFVREYKEVWSYLMNNEGEK